MKEMVHNDVRYLGMRREGFFFKCYIQGKILKEGNKSITLL